MYANSTAKITEQAMGIILTITALLLTAATLLPMLKARHWLIRGLDFPRLQIAMLLIVWLVVALLGLIAAWWAIGVLWWSMVIVCLSYQLWWIAPYSPFYPVEAARAKNKNLPQFSLLTSNVLMGNRDASRLIALVNEHCPDVLATLESDSWWQTKLDVLDAYPHRLACPLDNKYGMHVYSRLPFQATAIEYLVENDVPSMNLVVELNEKTTIRLHVVHPRPPAPGENTRSTERDVELLILAQHLDSVEGPLIVSGDLNDVAWSRTTRLFRRLSGLLDIRIGRGMFNSFHADYSFIRWPLDHFFVSTHFQVLEIKRLGHIGSDHFPVFTRLVLGQSDPDAAQLDLEDADQDLIEETIDTKVAAKASTPEIH